MSKLKSSRTAAYWPTVRGSRAGQGINGKIERWHRFAQRVHPTMGVFMMGSSNLLKIQESAQMVFSRQ
jgi:hypothetical protein